MAPKNGSVTLRSGCRPRRNSTTSRRPWPAAHLADYALIQAAGHGRREVVEFLLGQRPDLSVTEPFFGATARGAAEHQGYIEIAALIEARA